MSTCILMPTYDRYQPLAVFAVGVIDRYWENHPPVFLCGCRTQAATNYLALRDDPKDWIGILRSAAGDLIEAGYDKAYVIIDDCPPVARCSSRHLNVTLPDLMDRLKACNISLTGWDQRVGSKGEILGREFHRLQRLADDFLWRFSAGPGLWNLGALRELLDLLAPTSDLKSRTAWAFERRLGGGTVDIPGKWLHSSYRVCGLELLGGGLAGARRSWRKAARFVHHAIRFSIERGIGRGALERFDRGMSVCTSFYDGPYPAYWCGVMAEGKPNRKLITYLRLHGSWGYLSDMNAAIALVSGEKT